MKERFYIFSNGELKRHENTLYFEGEKGKKYIPVEHVSELLIFGEVTINKKLLEFLSQKEILLHFFNYYGYYVGTYYPREHYNSGYMILRQAEHYMDNDKRMALAKKFVEGGVENMLKVLGYYRNRGTPLDEEIADMENLGGHIEKQQTIEELMAIEGNIRKGYYASFNRIVRNEDFSFYVRSRRPPMSRMNSLISFGNSLCYVKCLKQIYQTHLDPRIGFLHSTNFRRFTLNLDVAEIFKPIIVDRCIFTIANKNMLRDEHFMEELDRVYLNDKGREIFVRGFEERMKSTIKHEKLKRNVSYETLIRMELYKIEKHLIGEGEYSPFVARW
jgi:CRISPR-associated protein, Cas1 family